MTSASEIPLLLASPELAWEEERVPSVDPSRRRRLLRRSRSRTASAREHAAAAATTKKRLGNTCLQWLLVLCTLLGGLNAVDDYLRGEVERPVTVSVLVEQHEEAVSDEELPVGEFPRLTAGMEVRHPAPRGDVQITRDGETVILRIRLAP